ncbi:MAG: ATP-dependent zinc metalloprotease FtsH [Bacteroidales bacterium]|nr:ATP-dependent zinc metalloprotease FtsH [Bacteroidales bacterium]
MEEKKKFNINPLSGKKDDKGKKPKFNIYWIYGILAVSFLLINLLFTGSDTSEIDWRRFENMVKDHDVEKIVVVNKDIAQVYLKPDVWSSGKYEDLKTKGFSPFPTSGPQCYFYIGSVDIINADLEKIQNKYNYSDEEKLSPSYETKKDIFGDLLGWIFPIVILVAVWLFIFRRMGGGTGGGGVGGGIFNVGKSKAKMFDKDATTVKVDFNDIAGLQEAKVEIEEIVDFLKNPKKYTELGGKIPKGALLVGPPGTGKTLLAKAVAGEANVPFFSMSGSDFVEMFVGVGASRVRDLFKQAKEKAPCIVFIDEIDAVGRARGRNPNFGANDERENTLNQLLTEMDGFASNAGVIVLAATNRADVLDKALLRAGRFDRQIHVDLPDLNERRAIFKVHLRPLKVDKKLDLEFLAKQTPGFSGADIANVCNEAALVAARKSKKQINKQDFLDAVDRIVGGLEKKNKIITIREKKTIAFHEAGHATVSWLLEHANPLVKVTIVPRGKALGAAWYLPEERQITTTEQLLDEMCSALGGRASEEINFNKISTGALNDLEKVTKQAYAMVTYFGMSSELGNISFYDSSGQSEYNFNKPYSEKTAELIDKEVKLMVENAYERTKKILNENRDKLTELAMLLLEREVIFSEDLEKIFGKRKEKDPEDMIHFAIDDKKTTTKRTRKRKTVEKDNDIEGKNNAGERKKV